MSLLMSDCGVNGEHTKDPGAERDSVCVRSKRSLPVRGKRDWPGPGRDFLAEALELNDEERGEGRGEGMRRERRDEG